MFFSTADKHEAIRARAREFAEAEIRPSAPAFDRDSIFPDGLVKKLGGLGWMGMPYPEEYGGAGLDALSYAIAVEELSRIDGGVGAIFSTHVSLASWPIFAYGTEAQKRKYLVPLASGRELGAFGLAEHDAGHDAASIAATAIAGDGCYILNGEKRFVANAGQAGIYIVFAATALGVGADGISAFIVEKGWEGFTFSEHYDKLGARSSPTATLIFNDVRIPKGNLLGHEGGGFEIARGALDGGRIAAAAQALGIAQGAFDSALTHSKACVQSGSPICFRPAVSFRLADMATKLRCARLMAYSAAELRDGGRPHSMEAAMAKQYASDMCLEVVNEALQIHGGTGYVRGADIDRAYRDAKICTIYEGSDEVQRHIIASHLIGIAPTGDLADGGRPSALTGLRKRIVLKNGTVEERAHALVKNLAAEGHDFTIGIDIDTPISQAERVVSVGKGIGTRSNMPLISALAIQAGAAIGSTRPVSETMKYLPLNRYIGMTGQKFNGSLYIACGISGAGQHLKGAKGASTIVAIDIDPAAPIFKNCDYGIIGDIRDVLPALTAALDNGMPKRPAPPVQRPAAPVQRPTAATPTWRRYICSGCGYEYNPAAGDPDGFVRPATSFDAVPEEWICPECGEEKATFIEA
ncbi:MAG: acyl-CoA dehydrogenase family protein [Clostridiales Family XIII bacterium]|jgi:alkylation response protein AidB-like acyl-CoA dehydrogenase/rubredoxin|nr:acyl-CoA dehydrogenase family protein [Clostridiales Family XIII bacterium]